MRTRSLVIAILCVALAGCGGPSQADKAAATASPGVDAAAVPAASAGIDPIADAALGTCACPQVPSIGTAAHPTPGQVRLELSPDDIRAIFSNRDGMYADDWTMAVKALANDIDANRIYGIAATAPPQTATLGLAEGGLSERLVRSSLTVDRSNLRRSMQPHAYDMNPINVSWELLRTLARTNLYGEPVHGLHDNAVALLRFLSSTLSEVKPADSRGTMLRGYAYGAENEIVQQLVTIVPRVSAIPRPVAALDRPGDLALPDFDMANAALDVLYSADAKEHAAGIDPAAWQTPQTTGHQVLAATLLELAGLRAAFGSPFKAGSPMDALGCKAYNVYLHLADPRIPGNERFRWDIVNQFFEIFEKPSDTPSPYLEGRWRAAQAALLTFGVNSDDEARALVKAAFVNISASSTPNVDAGMDQARATTVATLKSVRNLGGPFNSASTTFSTLVAQQIADFRARQKNHTGSHAETQVLALWDTDVMLASTNATLPKTCAAPQHHCDIETASTAPDEVQFEGRVQLHVRPAAEPDADIDVEFLTWNEPLVVEVEIPESSPRVASADVQVHVQESGKSTVVHLAPLPSTGGYNIYRSAPVSFNDTSKHVGGPGNFIGVTGHNGNTVAFDYADQEVSAIYYETPVQEGIASYQNTFDQITAYYIAQQSYPGLTPADSKELARKGLVLQNARRILAHQTVPDNQHFFQEHFNDLTRLAVAEKYLRVVNGETFGSPNYPDYAERAASTQYNGSTPYEKRFGITFSNSNEYFALRDALVESHAQYEAMLVRLASPITMGVYHAVVGASGVENYVVLWFGIDSNGNEYDVSGRVNAGLSIVKDLVISKVHADVFHAAVQHAMGERTLGYNNHAELLRDGELRVIEPGVILAEAEGGELRQIARAPGDGTSRLKGMPGGPVDAASEFGWAGEVVVRKAPLDGVPTLIQRFANTCGLSVAIASVKNLMPKSLQNTKLMRHLLTEGSLAVVAEDAGWYSPGIRAIKKGPSLPGETHGGSPVTYHTELVGGGMWEPEVAKTMEWYGATAKPFRTTDLRQLRHWRDLGYEVDVVVNPGNPGGGGDHWVRIEGFEKLPSGNPGVVIGDPGPGKSMTINTADFCQQLFHDHLGRVVGVVAKWPKKTV